MISQHPRIDAIVAVFETGHLPGPDAYGTVTILADGAGISYGIHQATDRSGNLDEVLRRYVDDAGRYAGAIEPFLARLARDESAQIPRPQWVNDLLALLRQAGADPVMQRAQAEVFGARAWAPTVEIASRACLVAPLTLLAIYDTVIQSGTARVAKLRAMFDELPPSRGGAERAWTRAFLQARRQFLAGFVSEDHAKQALVRSTVYRVDALLALVDAGRWDLSGELVVRGVRIP